MDNQKQDTPVNLMAQYAAFTKKLDQAAKEDAYDALRPLILVPADATAEDKASLNALTKDILIHHIQDMDVTIASQQMPDGAMDVYMRGLFEQLLKYYTADTSLFTALIEGVELESGNGMAQSKLANEGMEDLYSKDAEQLALEAGRDDVISELVKAGVDLRFNTKQEMENLFWNRVVLEYNTPSGSFIQLNTHSKTIKRLQDNITLQDTKELSEAIEVRAAEIQAQIPDCIAEIKDTCNYYSKIGATPVILSQYLLALFSQLDDELKYGSLGQALLGGFELDNGVKIHMNIALLDDVKLTTEQTRTRDFTNPYFNAYQKNDVKLVEYLNAHNIAISGRADNPVYLSWIENNAASSEMRAALFDAIENSEAFHDTKNTLQIASMAMEVGDFETFETAFTTFKSEFEDYTKPDITGQTQKYLSKMVRNALDAKKIDYAKFFAQPENASLLINIIRLSEGNTPTAYFVNMAIVTKNAAALNLLQKIGAPAKKEDFARAARGHVTTLIRDLRDTNPEMAAQIKKWKPVSSFGIKGATPT